MSEEPTPVSELDAAAATFQGVNGIIPHVINAGHSEDPLVVLLHGFPECWYGWAEYIDPLANAGHRVLVPDQRGYNPSDKPGNVRSYRLRTLSEDIVSLIACRSGCWGGRSSIGDLFGQRSTFTNIEPIAGSG